MLGHAKQLQRRQRIAEAIKKGRKSVSSRQIHIIADLILGNENQSRFAERYGVTGQYVSLLKKEALARKLLRPKAVWRGR